MHEGHLKCSKERVAALGSQHMAQCVAIMYKKNNHRRTQRVMELFFEFLLAVVIFGALVAFMNRMCEEELPDV